jgi:ZIP family zinc transporter
VIGSVPLAAFLPFVSTLAGGLAALRLRHRLHPFMALASGVLVATAVADLLPEAHDLTGSGRALDVGVAAILGFTAFGLVEAFIHQGSFEHAQTAYGQADGQPALAAAKRAGHLLAILPPASLILHSTLDGLAIGLGFQAGGGVGLGVLMAVLAHDLADGMNVVTLALDATPHRGLAVGFLLLDAIAPLVGAGISVFVSIPGPMLGLLLAWFAGVFLAIGAGHLLPEAQHHNPAEGPRLVVLSAVGAAIVLAVRSLL